MRSFNFRLNFAMLLVALLPLFISGAFGLYQIYCIESDIDDIVAPNAKTNHVMNISVEEAPQAMIVDIYRTEVKKHKNSLLRLLLILTGGVIIVSYFVSFRMSKPVKRLHKLVFKSRPVANNGDEMEALASLVDKTVNKLKTAEDVLKSQDAKMQKQVDSKTREMKKVISELQDTKAAVLNMMEDVVEANEELKQLDEAKSNFLNMVSHELKTPLTAMTAHLEVLHDMDKNLSEQQKGSLTAIRRNSDSLRMLIENILEIARIESKKFELNITKVDVNDIIRETVVNLRILALNKKVKLIAETQNLPAINSDEARLKEILNNLISNAIKFTERGSVRVRSRKTGNFILVEVIDTGIGIPEDKIENLFTKFYQVDGSLSRRYGGTGLGLSITKQLVELQGGKIGLQSQVKKGSRFFFTLPIRGGKK